MNAQPAITARRLHQLVERWTNGSALSDAHVALDYPQLVDAIIACADQLRELGVRPGDRVLIASENSAATGVLVLACSRIDAWFCVVNARLSPREIDGIREHSGARRVLYTAHVSADAARHAQRHGAQDVTFPAIGVLPVGPLDTAATPEPCFDDPARQVAGLIYTSGTSGAPKGVMLSHASIAFAADAVVRLRGAGPGDLFYGALPMAHVVGLSTQLLGALANGAALRTESRFTPAALVQALADGATAFTGVPAMYSRTLEWLREQGRRIDAPALRVLGVAGSPLTPTLKAQVEEAFGVPLLNGYGLTETAPTIAQVRVAAPRADCAVGPPIPGIEVRIVGKDRAPVEPGSVGELQVRGPNVMRGYYRNEALTREAIDPQGWFATGDLVRQDADGALHVAGRSKELIIRSGFNVYPLEVEQVLNSHPDILQSAVVGRATADNEEVVAFVEPAAGRSIDDDALRAFLRERLSPYKLPAEIRVLAPLPSSPTGKVLKATLKEMAASPITTQAPQETT